jgi:hypothetical protein
MIDASEILSVILYFYLVTGLYVSGLIVTHLSSLSVLEKVMMFFGHVAVWPLSIAVLVRELFSDD